jgi:hypothetical protein
MSSMLNEHIIQKRNICVPVFSWSPKIPSLLSAILAPVTRTTALWVLTNEYYIAMSSLLVLFRSVNNVRHMCNART